MYYSKKIPKNLKTLIIVFFKEKVGVLRAYIKVLIVVKDQGITKKM
jgi:hypothetical protein